MNRIRAKLISRGGGKLLVPFFTVGYPDFRKSLEFVNAGLDAGADLVELGMPFSDPMADGPDIQLSSQVALEAGVDMRAVFRAVRSLRQHSDIPIILMGYYNPVFAFGVDRFAREARRAGVDGLIIPDLPVEEADELRQSARRDELSLIFLVAPTSSADRIKMIDRACSDFVYAVTTTGVTGSRFGFDRSTDAYLKALRSRLSKPFVAGFGVSSPRTARQLSRYADGAVIGSALIRTYRQARTHQSGLARVGRLLRSIRQALA